MISFLLGMLFYGSIFASLMIACMLPYLEDGYSSFLCEKRREEMLSEFKDVLYSISASVAAGRQFPKAVEDAADSLELCLGPSSILSGELKSMSQRYRQQNGSLETMLEGFASRSGIDEIALFARSCSICRRCGGNLEEVCLKNAYIIIGIIEYRNEARAVLAEKKMDIAVMVIMPLAVLLFLNLFSYGYIRVLYECFEGKILMTAALALMAAALLWSLKVMKLKL